MSDVFLKLSRARDPWMNTRSTAVFFLKTSFISLISFAVNP